MSEQLTSDILCYCCDIVFETGQIEFLREVEISCCEEFNDSDDAPCQHTTECYQGHFLLSSDNCTRHLFSSFKDQLNRSIFVLLRDWWLVLGIWVHMTKGWWHLSLQDTSDRRLYDKYCVNNVRLHVSAEVSLISSFSSNEVRLLVCWRPKIERS